MHNDERWEDLCHRYYEWGRMHALSDRLKGCFRKKGRNSSGLLPDEYDACMQMLCEAGTATSRRAAFRSFSRLLKKCYFRGYNERERPCGGRPHLGKRALWKDIPVVWRGYFFSASGYGQGTHSYVGELVKRGFFVYREELEVAQRLQPQFHRNIMLLPKAAWPNRGALAYISHTPPFSFDARKGMLNVGVTTWETTSIPRDWVEKCSTMDEIWVACTFNERSFRESGVKTPIRILPYGVDTDAYHPGREPVTLIPGTAIPSKMLKGFFCFLTIGALYPYKGYDALLTAYIREFSPKEPVMLLLKVYRYFAQEHDSLRQIIRSICDENGIRKPPHIFIIEHTLEKDMPGLMQLCDAYISTSRGEGFCLPLLEAMAMRKIVISVAFGGPRDYLREDNSFFINHREVPVVKGSHPYHTTGSWAEPDIDHIRHQMRWVYEHRAEAEIKARKAEKDVREGWTTVHAGNRLEACLEDLYERLL
jgi:glycosyltransferase involved in cell wall biosynthesis